MYPFPIFGIREVVGVMVNMIVVGKSMARYIKIFCH